MELDPEGLLAARLLDAAAAAGHHLHITRTEARAARLASAARALAGEEGGVEVIHLPAPDTPPYDRADPSPALRGARLAALAALRRPAPGPRLLLLSPQAALIRLPREAPAPLLLRPGDPAPAEGALEALGLAADELVDSPGEFARRGSVLDIFPALPDAAPHRLELDGEGRIRAIRRYDPATQRSLGEAASLEVPPAREDPAGELISVFELLPDAAPATMEPEVPAAAAEFLREAADAFRLRLAGGLEEGEAAPREPAALCLDAAEWKAVSARAKALERPAEEPEPLPFLDPEEDPEEAFLDAVERARRAGKRVALAGAGQRAQALARALRARFGGPPPPEVAGWQALLALPPGALAWLRRPLLSSFETAEALVVAAAEVLPPAAGDGAGPARLLPVEEPDLAPGDLVLHEEWGMARLAGLASVEGEDALRLDFAGGASRLLPVDELHRLWRYGAEAEGVALDRPGGEVWPRKLAAAEEALRATARGLLEARRRRRGRTAPAWRPPRRLHARFCDGFPHALTPDQEGAARDALRDLASGAPMDRLVCGDVGFGKTEIALRAAAAVALAGGQAAVLAPTTVLARQHFETFRRRFAPFGAEVGMLSRLTPPAEARRVRAALADGSLALVVGTQAVLSKSVRFARLGLVVVDEEQRFGARQKSALRGLAEGAHLLSMTATPIPRSLQGAMLGTQSLSVLAVPPARRQPVRTAVAAEEDALLREALLRERRRGGQSFVVVPRIEDIAPMRARLRALAPRLRLAEAHGGMPPAEADEAMLRFAEGRADALLCTAIVETGLDVPRAGTILICGADRFGLAQLHQLRGRVGRGGSRGACWLLTRGAVTPSAARRLRTLAEESRLGAGFGIAARDLDQRGAGDLLGEEQAGHVRRLGLPLTRHLLERALAEAEGRGAEGAGEPPALALPIPAGIPEGYVPEEALRLALHARAARAADEAALDALEEEMADRFGAPLPDGVAGLLLRARLRLRARRLGVARLEAGPAAAAASFAGAPPEEVPAPLLRKGDRVLLPAEGRPPQEVAEELLERLAAAAARFRRARAREAATAPAAAGS